MASSKSFALVAIAGAALAFASTSANAAPAPACSGPAVGNDSAGPALCITLNSNGTASIVNGPGFGQGPYDGVEDTYVGVINNTSGTVSAITLSSTNDIFGFDGDGIGVMPSGGYPGVGAGTIEYGTPNSSDHSNGGYGGPNGFFSNITTVAGVESGVVHFIAALAANGGTTYFSLEHPLTAADFTAQIGSTPLPAALPLFAGGLGMLGWLSGRRKRKTAS
jgi:hypothetical protein